MARDNERPERDNSESGRRGSDRNSSDRPRTDRGEKKIFNRRDKYERGEAGERRSFGGDRREGGERRSFDRDRSERGERRSFNSDRGERGERRSFNSERPNREGRENRSYGADKREGGEIRSFSLKRDDRERRPYGGDRREEGEGRSFKSDRREGGDRRSFGGDRREGGEKRSFNSDRREGSERRSYGSDRREGGERRSFGGDRREGGERRSFDRDHSERGEQRGERRSFNSDRGERRSFNSDRPDQLHSEERKSYKERRESAERRLRGDDREERGRKSFGSERRDDRRGNREDRPSTGERRNFRDDKKEFKSNPKERLGKEAAGRRGRYIDREGEPETPNYNTKRYEDNPRIKKSNRKDKEDDGTIRLNRYIANAGVCSRREADALIEAGEIKVNGEVVTEMGYKVNPSDTIQYGKKILNREKLVYVLLNKPKDFITTTDDPEGRKTVMDLVEKASNERIFPVGRLDRNTTGLLLFTNDGELAQKLTHPSNDIRKIYQVELDKPITKDHFQQIVEGLELEDGKAEVDDLALVGDSNKFLGIEIHIGRNRIVRRIFEHLGYEVVSLDRVQYAGLTKKDLPRGNWRYLSEKELIRLKYFV